MLPSILLLSPFDSWIGAVFLLHEGDPGKNKGHANKRVAVELGMSRFDHYAELQSTYSCLRAHSLLFEGDFRRFSS